MLIAKTFGTLRCGNIIYHRVWTLEKYCFNVSFLCVCPFFTKRNSKYSEPTIIDDIFSSSFLITSNFQFLESKGHYKATTNRRTNKEILDNTMLCFFSFNNRFALQWSLMCMWLFIYNKSWFWPLFHLQYYIWCYLCLLMREKIRTPGHFVTWI